VIVILPRWPIYHHHYHRGRRRGRIKVNAIQHTRARAMVLLESMTWRNRNPHLAHGRIWRRCNIRSLLTKLLRASETGIATTIAWGQ
jgi:hypothetical protein